MMPWRALWKQEPPSTEINVLVAESDPEIARSAEMCCQTDRFKVRTVSTLISLQRELDRALKGEGEVDLLILDPSLANGSAQPALRQWSQWYSNPLIIVTSDDLSVGDRDELILQGAWFILDDPMNYAVLGRQVRRFGRVIYNERRTQHLEKEVTNLRKITLVLLIAVAIALGESLFPHMVSWTVGLISIIFGG
jgi:DNA-binding response OmpR family regulator